MECNDKNPNLFTQLRRNNGLLNLYKLISPRGHASIEKDLPLTQPQAVQFTSSVAAPATYDPPHTCGLEVSNQETVHPYHSTYIKVR